MEHRKIFVVEVAPYGTLYFDPVVVRRRLLHSTNGGIWRLIEGARINQERIQEAVDALAEDNAKPEADRYNQEMLDKIESYRAVAEYELTQQEGQLADAAFYAFELVRMDKTTGHGMTESEVNSVLMQFLEYAEKKG